MVERALPRVKYASPRPGCTSSVSSMLAKGDDYIRAARGEDIERGKRMPCLQRLLADVELPNLPMIDHCTSGNLPTLKLAQAQDRQKRLVDQAAAQALVVHEGWCGHRLSHLHPRWVFRSLGYGGLPVLAGGPPFTS